MTAASDFPSELCVSRRISLAAFFQGLGGWFTFKENQPLVIMI